MTGAGTQANPFVVATMDDFVTAIEVAGAYITLNNDIDAKDWVPTSNHQYVFACNQVDGAGYAIKNLHVHQSQYSIGILFRLSATNTTGVMKDLHWLNVYMDGVVFFITASSGRYGWSISDCTFQIELVDGKFIQQDYTVSSFYQCGIYLYCTGTDSNTITGDGNNVPCLFHTCAIEVNGVCDYKIFTGQLYNSHLTGEVTLSNPDSGGTYMAGISIFNQGDYQYAASVIDMTVHCSTTWYIWNYYLYSTCLVVNTDHLEHYTLQGATDIFISATTTQLNNATWLQNHGFDVSTHDVGFIWRDWMINNGNVRITQVDYEGHGTTLPFTVDVNTNQLFVDFSDIAINGYWATEPFSENQSGTYYFTANSFHRYKITIQADMEVGMTPMAIFYRNGTELGRTVEWSENADSYSCVFTAPDNTVRLSLRIGGRNRSDANMSGSCAINNVQIISYSDWTFTEGTLVNQSIPPVPIMGAFCNDTNLVSIDIPASVKYIGPYAFRRTLLSHVKIASDCRYFTTSFPDGCVIEHW